MKLNLGCGTDIHKGWVNADRINGEGVDSVFDASKGIPFSDNVFEEIYVSHLLEHLMNWPDVLLECHRVLKPNAPVKIRVPYGVGPQNPDALHVRFFWPGTMDMFTMPKRSSPGIDAHKYNGTFKLVHRRVLRMLWFHWHIQHYLGIKLFERMKYRFPLGEKKEIVWLLRKIP